MLGHLESVVDSGRLHRSILNTSEGYPLPMHVNKAGLRSYAGMFAAIVTIATGCSSNPFDAPPPTIEPAAFVYSDRVSRVMVTS